jgi:hypothetical protein
MNREDIQASNPGGVGNRPAPRVVASSPDDGSYNRLLGGAAFLARRRNFPAYLASAGGFLAISFVFIGLEAQHNEPRWLGPMWVYLPVAGWVGSILGIPTVFMGAAGIQRSWHPAADGFHWAWIGLLLGVCAILGAVALYLEPLSKINCC